MASKVLLPLRRDGWFHFINACEIVVVGRRESGQVRPHSPLPMNWREKRVSDSPVAA